MARLMKYSYQDYKSLPEFEGERYELLRRLVSAGASIPAAGAAFIKGE